MRRRGFASVAGGLLCGALAALTTLPTSAVAADTGPPLVSPERQGYAFEYPRILTEQRLFGIAHGVALLAEACRAVPQTAAAAADAYATWLAQQQAQIDAIQAELAFFYYGPHAAEANPQNLVAALKLRTELSLAPDSEQLIAACATLPEALQQPRYDLTALFELESALAAVARSTRVEALGKACAPKLSDADRQILTARLAEWHDRENAAAETAHMQMLRDWARTATPGEAEPWVQALRQRYSDPSMQTCAGLAEWLQTPAASLAQSFAMPPLPEATMAAQAPVDGSVAVAVAPAYSDNGTGMDAAHPLPPAEQAPCPVRDAITVEVVHDPAELLSNLFDLLTKALNEPPQIPDPNAGE